MSARALSSAPVAIAKIAELDTRPSAPRILRPGARPRSLGRAPLTDAERIDLGVARRDLRSVYRWRPRTWGDCERRSGPCGFVSCSMNLYLDVDDLTGAVKLNFPDREIDELAETCALRVAARGALSLEEVGKLTNLTQERVSTIEEGAAQRARRRVSGSVFRGEIGGGAPAPVNPNRREDPSAKLRL